MQKQLSFLRLFCANLFLLKRSSVDVLSSCTERSQGVQASSFYVTLLTHCLRLMIKGQLGCNKNDFIVQGWRKSWKNPWWIYCHRKFYTELQQGGAIPHFFCLKVIGFSWFNFSEAACSLLPDHISDVSWLCCVFRIMLNKAAEKEIISFTVGYL